MELLLLAVVVCFHSGLFGGRGLGRTATWINAHIVLIECKKVRHDATSVTAIGRKNNRPIKIQNDLVFHTLCWNLFVFFVCIGTIAKNNHALVGVGW